MDEVFTSTYWQGGLRRLLVNNERILYLERLEKADVITYFVRFDTGSELELDCGTGEALERELQNVSRPLPPVQYVRQPRLLRRSPKTPR